MDDQLSFGGRSLLTSQLLAGPTTTNVDHSSTESELSSPPYDYNPFGAAPAAPTRHVSTTHSLNPRHSQAARTNRAAGLLQRKNPPRKASVRALSRSVSPAPCTHASRPKPTTASSRSPRRSSPHFGMASASPRQPIRARNTRPSPLSSRSLTPVRSPRIVNRASACVSPRCAVDQPTPASHSMRQQLAEAARRDGLQQTYQNSKRGATPRAKHFLIKAQEHIRRADACAAISATQWTRPTRRRRSHSSPAVHRAPPTLSDSSHSTLR